MKHNQNQNTLHWSYRFGQLPLASLDPSKRGAWWVELGLGVQFTKCFCCFRNPLTSFWEVSQDFLVGKANDFNTKLLENSGSFSILSQTFLCVMLRTVKFNHQFARGTIKIHNKLSYWALPQPSFRLQFQKVIPKFAFWFRHFSPQFLRSSRKFFVVPQPWHPNILNPFPSLAPLFEGSSEARGSS
jgi:hypothetical protein